MKERNYLEANDIYLRLAIGNSPWPIGVTQVYCMLFIESYAVKNPTVTHPNRLVLGNVLTYNIALRLVSTSALPVRRSLT